MRVVVDKFIVMQVFPYEEPTILEFDDLEEAIGEYMRRNGPNDVDVYFFVQPRMHLTVVLETEDEEDEK